MKHKCGKYCTSCKIVYGIKDFYKRRKGLDLSPYCKNCTRLNVLKRQRNVKKLAVNYLGGKCQKCGYNKCIGALQFHHIDPTKKSKEYYNMKLRTFNDKFKKELNKCILLCANCHLEEHTTYCS